MAREAEEENPPLGRFIEVDGVRLHVIERGQGTPLVVLHGNGSLAQEFLLGGFVALASRTYRVIIFDRPGYGYSARPRGRIFSPGDQARLFAQALETLGVTRPILLGHSWGASVATAWALQRPGDVRGLVLESGYYHPSPRLDVWMAAALGLPVLGDIVRQTVAASVARLMWPRMRRKLFWPARVPDAFLSFPLSMALRPSQIRASAAESALMIPSAFVLNRRYARLRVPVALVAGAGDQMVEPQAQSVMLHRRIPHSLLCVVPGCGHMVHQTAPSTLLRVVAELHRRSDS
ncbi:alpha/beta fold hydrolase [Methylobacterium sp. ID0610]|uniref:alpha/beta fold hydrolase n=1 Tax=Methylobacterium carpenticola TaxID=3344827 RepID=UPI00368B9B16